MDNEILIPTLSKIGFSDIYIALCNNFGNFKDGKTPSINVIRESNILYPCMSYSNRDKCFYMEEIINDLIIYLSISFNKGLIECIYSIKNIEEEFATFASRFDSLAVLNNYKFEDLVKCNLPISASDNDFKNILEQVLMLDKEFKAELQNEL
ncbi:hypothetical protein [Zobellia uliginosa]|uniref:hypothetical protein n=1 Tax=Zobellia uliginosa TaxID=143224 RepID=UPI001C064A9E|nr:hypothetical protein [Zobellia uliginosa]MBU2946037.1 hypothetical protein [Zobellia uliginosa]